MPVIGWSESSPADGDSAGQGDNEIRSLKTAIRVGLDGEHVWPSGGGDAGVHRLGAARTHYGAQSLVSSTGTDGRLMVTSDTSRLFHVGSVATSFIGGPTVISAGSYPGGAPPQRNVWIQEFGRGTTVSSGGTTITIPNSGYSAAPFVHVTPSQTGSGLLKVFATVASRTATSFVVAAFDHSGVTTAVDFDWTAVGIRVL